MMVLMSETPAFRGILSATPGLFGVLFLVQMSRSSTMSSLDGLRLMKAFMHVRPALQRCIVDLVDEIAGESGE